MITVILSSDDFSNVFLQTVSFVCVLACLSQCSVIKRILHFTF